MKKRVERFHLQPTKSFEYAPQREEYDNDFWHLEACKKYAAEWLDEYICGNTNCLDRSCPQHFKI